MSAFLDIQQFGFFELQAKLQRLPETIQKEAQRLIFDGAQRIANAAKANAPVDTGYLKSDIYAEKTGDFSASVISGADYSAYQEFGTGDHVDVPPELTEYALQFKGTKHIKGQYAHPYLFPALEEVGPTITADVEAMLIEELEK